MKQWKRWIREDLKGLGLFLVLAGGLLYAILFWFGYHLTYDNTILPGGNFWLVGGEILLTGIVAAGSAGGAFPGAVRRILQDRNPDSHAGKQMYEHISPDSRCSRI